MMRFHVLPAPFTAPTHAIIHLRGMRLHGTHACHHPPCAFTALTHAIVHRAPSRHSRMPSSTCAACDVRPGPLHGVVFDAAHAIDTAARLAVTVVSGSYTTSSCSEGIFDGSCDAYVRISVDGGPQATTPIVSNDNSPTWNYEVNQIQLQPLTRVPLHARHTLTVCHMHRFSAFTRFTCRCNPFSPSRSCLSPSSHC
jgi:hypothetical protein